MLSHLLFTLIYVSLPSCVSPFHSASPSHLNALHQVGFTFTGQLINHR